VLLVDGEELVGAKQNRVLNTTVLLAERSETIIPVSCTEQGRWTYASPHFGHSNHIMAATLRKMKSCHVTDSLKNSDSYSADQGAIWAGIHSLAFQANVQSPSSALHHVFAAKADELNDYLTAFQPFPKQKGLLVFISGEVAGLDIVSLKRAYQVLHPTLVRSFAIDALLKRTDTRTEKFVEKATAFVEEAAKCEESRHPSIGYGQDYRFEGQNVAGSALVSHEHVIHATLFNKV